MAENKKQPQNNLRFYDQLRVVPDGATKPIIGGRLKGMSNINPMFRFRAMTETFGPCGIGWKYEIVKQWQEVYGVEVKAFTNINLFIKVDGEWSEPIPGIGGATLVEASKSGQYVNDEGYKCALTDALSVAMKALGVAADVYFAEGMAYSDNKYDQQKYAEPQSKPEALLIQMYSEATKKIDACKTQAELIDLNQQYQDLWSYQKYVQYRDAKWNVLTNGK